MRRQLTVFDLSVLRSIDKNDVQQLLLTSSKVQGTVSARSLYFLVDLEFDGSLLDQQQQHAGCKEKIAEEAYGQQHDKSLDPKKRPTFASTNIYHLTTPGLSRLLAKESTGAPRLQNLQQVLQQLTGQLRRFGGAGDSSSVTVLIKLPSTLESIETFLEIPEDLQQLPDPEEDEQACFRAIYLRCQQLLVEWLQIFMSNSTSLVLLATGYDETAATKLEALLAYSLHLLLLTKFPAGSSMCPMQLSERSDGRTWEVDRTWHKNVLKHLVTAAGPTIQLNALMAKATVLKLANDIEGAMWLNEQYRLFMGQPARGLGQAARLPGGGAATADLVRATHLGTKVPATVNIQAACQWGTVLEATPAVATGNDLLQQPHLTITQQKQILERQLQLAKSNSTGCPGNTNVSASRRYGACAARGMPALLGRNACRSIATSDLPQNGKQHGNNAQAAAAAAAAGFGAGRTLRRARRGNPGSGLLQPVWHSAQGHMCQQKLRQPREPIPPIRLAADTETVVEDAGGNNEGLRNVTATSTVMDSHQQQPESTAQPLTGRQQHQSQVQQQPSRSVRSGCLAAVNLEGNAAAEVGVAAVKQQVERLSAVRQHVGPLGSNDIPQLEDDIDSLCQATVKAVVQQCGDNQQQWSYALSAGARDAAAFAKGQLNRLDCRSLKHLAHKFDGLDYGLCDAIISAADAKLPSPGKAAVRLARLRQSLLVISGKENYLLSRPKTGVVYIPEVVLEPAFWILFCLHSILLVGPLVPGQYIPSDMSDPAGVSAQVQYVAAERRVNWYLDNMNIGWDLWTWRIKKDKQQQQQQAETAAGGKTLVPAVTKPDQPDDQLQQLLFKQHAGVFDWFVSLVLPDLELQRWLGGLYELLKVWTRPNVPGQRPMEVPRAVDFASRHQLGDPALLGAALQKYMRQQEEQRREALHTAVRSMRELEAARKQQEAEFVGEEVGTTEWVQDDALPAAAAAAAEGEGAKQQQDGADQADRCARSATKPSKRRRSVMVGSSKRAAVARPSAALPDPLKAMKGLHGLPGKRELRLEDLPKQKKQKPNCKYACVPRELADDADSCQPRTAATAAGCYWHAGIGPAVGAHHGSASSPGGPCGHQKPKAPNRFARQKVVKQPVLGEDQQQVKAGLASFGINLGQIDQQRNTTTATGCYAGVGHGSGSAAASGDPCGHQKPKALNRFARQKVVSQPVVIEDQQQIEAELAGFGINLGQKDQQHNITPAAPTLAPPAAAAARPQNISGLAAVFGAVSNKQQQALVSFLAARPAPVTSHRVAVVAAAGAASLVAAAPQNQAAAAAHEALKFSKHGGAARGMPEVSAVSWGGAEPTAARLEDLFAAAADEPTLLGQVPDKLHRTGQPKTQQPRSEAAATARGAKQSAAAAAVRGAGGEGGCSSLRWHHGTSTLPIRACCPDAGRPPYELQQQADESSDSLADSREEHEGEVLPDVVPATPSDNHPPKSGSVGAMCRPGDQLKLQVADMDLSEHAAALPAQCGPQKKMTRPEQQEVVTVTMQKSNKQSTAAVCTTAAAAVAATAGPGIIGLAPARPLVAATAGAGTSSRKRCSTIVQAAAALVKVAKVEGAPVSAAAAAANGQPQPATTWHSCSTGHCAQTSPPPGSHLTEIGLLDQPAAEATRVPDGPANRLPNFRAACFLRAGSLLPPLPSLETLQEMCVKAAAIEALFRAAIAQAKKPPEEDDTQHMDPLTRELVALHRQVTSDLFQKPHQSLEQIRGVQKRDKKARRKIRQQKRDAQATKREASARLAQQ